MFAVISRSSAEQKPARTDHFSLQRSRGTLDLAFASRNGVTHAERVFQQGAMKVRFPNVERGLDGRRGPPEAVILNTAGGLTGGDRLGISLHMASGTTATLTSQACEKIYRANTEPASVTVNISLEPGAAMDWLPQPAIFFDGARLHRETHVEMTEDSRILALEGVIFGRAAMGEHVAAGHLSDSWFIRRDGRLIHADRFDTGANIGEMLSKQTVLKDCSAMASLRYIAPDAESRIGEMRALLEPAQCIAAASAWDGLMLVRMAAADSYTLNQELMRVLGGFRSRPMPRVWSI